MPDKCKEWLSSAILITYLLPRKKNRLSAALNAVIQSQPIECCHGHHALDNPVQCVEKFYQSLTKNDSTAKQIALSFCHVSPNQN